MNAPKKMLTTKCWTRAVLAPATILLVLASIADFPASFAQEIAQWRGRNRSGVYPDTALLRSWPAAGPRLCWYADGIGNGHSSAVSVGNSIYVTGSRNDSDYLTAISDSGRIRWQVSYGIAWSGSYAGAKCTPVSDGKNVWVLSAYGVVACIDAITGKNVWTLDAGKKFEASPCSHGICESLLLSGNMVFYTPGGPLTTLVALDKDNGNTLWQTESLNDNSSYASPLLIRHAGKDIVVALTDNYLIGVDVSDGAILFRENYSKMEGATNQTFYASSNAVTPLFHEGYIYLTEGYNYGGVLFRINDQATDLEEVWADDVLDCQMGGVVRVDGYIYGSNWVSNGKGNWCCVDWNTGKMMYETAWQTKGAIISADSMLYCYEEKSGSIGLVKAIPQQFEVVSSFRVPYGNGPHWAHPVISGGILLVRHGDVVMAFDLRQGKDPVISASGSDPKKRVP